KDSTVIKINSSSSGLFEHGMQRFMEEAQMLKRLENVPEVVRVNECFQDNQTAYFSMEFLDGTNLKSIVKNIGSTIDYRDMTRLIAAIGNAMDIIHKTTGILHRDISPENICVLKDGSARLLDFGSARQTIAGAKQGFSVELKPGFAPLEQYSKNGKQGPYTDVYALACTYYYSLTGKMIPSAVDRLEGKEYEPLCQINPEISAAVSAGVDRALELDYRSRTQSMREFVDIISRDLNKQPLKSVQKTRRVAFLEVANGGGKSSRWKLPPDTEVVLGRSMTLSNIVLTANPLVSKEHCKIIYKQASNLFLITDISRNGTFTDKGRLERGRYYEFSPDFNLYLVNQECVVKAGVSYE
ncbi:MAG: hypothetical protein K0R23_2897, partial [Lacrimispora sp.]|nr:hypothetical protein [Lacrimispora sp.]